jgi:hypothetical protein
MIRILLILLLFGHNSFGQTLIRGVTTISTDGIKGDTVNNSPNNFFNNRIKLVQIDKSSAKVDIRLYRLHSLSNTITLRRLFMVDTTWQAVEYEEWNNPVKINKYELTAKNSFDSIFISLLANNVMTLQNQSEIVSNMERKKEITAEGDTLVLKMMIVVDGDIYTMEIKIANKYRIYRFDNPATYFKYYPTISEFNNYTNIVETLDTWLCRK